MGIVKKYVFWIALAAIAVTGGMAIAELTMSGDDPAVVACETILTSQLKSPKSYERVSAKIDGTTVLVSYDAVNSFNAPIRDEKFCNFELNDEGKFAIAVPDTTGPLKALTQEMNTLNKSTVTPAVVQGYRDRIAELTKKGMEQILVSAHEESSLKDKDWYPINPAKTKLKSAP